MMKFQVPPSETPESGSLNDLLPAAYRDLKKTASRYSGSPESTSALGLVHEAYLKLATAQQTFENQQHLRAAAALTIRRLAIDKARSRARTKRGGDRTRVPLLDPMCTTAPVDSSEMDLASALEELARWDQRKARAVGLHYFEGFGIQETANKLKISRRTVLRDLETSKAWLLANLTGEGSDTSS